MRLAIICAALNESAADATGARVKAESDAVEQRVLSISKGTQL